MNEPTSHVEHTVPEPLAPHRYPAWVIASAVIVVLAVVYSLFLLPKYYKAGSLLEKAQRADAAQQTQEAVDLLEKALTYAPDSKKVRLELAYEDFKLPTDIAHKRGLDVIGGVNMDAEEWGKIYQVMPAEYRDQFHETDEPK